MTALEDPSMIHSMISRIQLGERLFPIQLSLPEHRCLSISTKASRHPKPRALLKPAMLQEPENPGGRNETKRALHVAVESAQKELT